MTISRWTWDFYRLPPFILPPSSSGREERLLTAGLTTMESFSDAWELSASVLKGWPSCVCPTSIDRVLGAGIFSVSNQGITLSCAWGVDGEEAGRDDDIFTAFTRFVEVVSGNNVEGWEGMRWEEYHEEILTTFISVEILDPLQLTLFLLMCPHLPHLDAVFNPISCVHEMPFSKSVCQSRVV